MTEPVLDTSYWKERLERAPKDAPHHAVFRCSAELWRRIEEKHRQILTQEIKPGDSILDAGCGWGRLLDLLPRWDGRYLGVDLSPDFVEKARWLHPTREFVVGDLRRLDFPDTFQWAVLISIRPMMRRNLGEEEWSKMESELRRVAKRLLFLEYDDTDEGSVE